MSIPAKVYSAESPLQNPADFIRGSVQDMRASRDFARRLFRQFIAQRYRYSSLGLLWAFAPPIITTLVLALSRRNMPSGGVTVATQIYAVFGLMMTQTFLETFYTQRTLFSSNRALLSRHRATVESLVLAGLYDSLFGLSIKAGIFACFMIAFHVHPTAFLLGVIGTGVILLLGTGLGLCFAPVSALKSDADKILAFLPWMLFGLTPIFTPAVAGSGMNRIYNANPFTWLFDAVRAIAFNGAHGQILTLAIFLLISLCIFPAATLYCRIARPHVVERFLD